MTWNCDLKIVFVYMVSTIKIYGLKSAWSWRRKINLGTSSDWGFECKRILEETNLLMKCAEGTGGVIPKEWITLYPESQGVTVLVQIIKHTISICVSKKRLKFSPKNGVLRKSLKAMGIFSGTQPSTYSEISFKSTE